MCLTELLSSDLSNCPVRFEIIEQVVLARNRAQHGSSIHTFHVNHDPKTLEKHPEPHFAESQYRILSDAPGFTGTWFGPQIEVTEENLTAAIDEVENLAEWISQHDGKLYERRFRAPNQR